MKHKNQKYENVCPNFSRKSVVIKFSFLLQSERSSCMLLLYMFTLCTIFSCCEKSFQYEFSIINISSPCFVQWSGLHSFSLPSQYCTCWLMYLWCGGMLTGESGELFHTNYITYCRNDWRI